jgi:hypothetical protein
MGFNRRKMEDQRRAARADKEAASRRCLPEWSVWSGAELHRTTPWPSLRQARHPLKLKGQPQDDHPY